MIFGLSYFQKVVRRIENTKTGGQDKPVEDVVIAACGEIEVKSPYSVEKEAAGTEAD